MEKKRFMFQKFGTREYIWAEDPRDALKLYNKMHGHEISQIKNWIWREDMQRFIVNR